MLKGKPAEITVDYPALTILLNRLICHCSFQQKLALCGINCRNLFLNFPLLIPIHAEESITSAGTVL
jgi:hypothetical protein